MRNDHSPFFSEHLEAFFAPLVQRLGKASLVLDEKKNKKGQEGDGLGQDLRERRITSPPFPFPSLCFFVVMRQVLTQTWMNLPASVFCGLDSRKFFTSYGSSVLHNHFRDDENNGDNITTIMKKIGLALFWEFYLTVTLQMLVGKKSTLVYIFKPI